MNKNEVVEQIKVLSKEKTITKRYSNTLNYYAKKYFNSWNNAIKVAGFNPNKEIQEINFLNKNKDFYYFLGLMITDGHILIDAKNGKYKISVYTSYEKEKELISKIIKDLFKYNAGIYKRKTGFSKNQNYDIYINSKYLTMRLTEMGFPHGNRSKANYNKFFRNIPKKHSPHFVRGIIDGDGSISKYIVMIHSGSKNFLLNLKNLLNRMYITSKDIRKEKTCYTIGISRRENLIKMFRILDYKNVHYPRKLDNWNTNIFKYYKMPYFKIPL